MFVCEICSVECESIHEHTDDEISQMLRDFMLHVHLTETIDVLTDYLEQLDLNTEQIALVKKVYNFTVDLNHLPEINTVRVDHWFDQSQVNECLSNDTVPNEEFVHDNDVTNTMSINAFDEDCVNEENKENMNPMHTKKRKTNSDETMGNVKRKRSMKCVRCQLQKKPCDYQYPCNRCLNARKNDMTCYYEY